MSEVKKGPGRPTFEIDVKEFKKLCELHCTLEEMAGWYDVDVNTIEAWCKRTFKLNFSEAFKRYSGKGKISLRRSQWLAATDKMNVSMLIWLGKQYLGQKDTIEHSGNAESPVQLAYAKPSKKQVKEKIDEVISQEEEQLEGEETT